MTRKIPAAGINLFQLIYILIREYEEKSGTKALNLSLGNPDLIPFKEVREFKSRIQLKTDYDLHTYAEDKNLNQFCEGMIRAFTGVELSKHAHLRATPIAGIKTATAILPLACGLHLKGRGEFHVVTHLPAYDVMGTWSSSYLGSNRIVWPLSSEDGMAMKMDRLQEALKKAGVERPDLIFVIRPGNPAARGASRQEWLDLIEFCQPRGIRLVNDGAYTTLRDVNSHDHVPLAQVAKDFPDLEWAELYSVSKSFSDPGARLGTMVGSREFIEDYTLIKGNTDSGPVPTMMAAYGELFSDEKLTRRMLDDLYRIYQARLDYLVPRLKKAGLRPACETTAGFFTLWQTPDFAFGINLVEESANRKVTKSELFNRLVIERTGVVGVHFQGPALGRAAPESFIRYAVCTDVLDPEFQVRLDAALIQVEPRYL
ncbi:MAG: aminotransferase class I/II-fold pyridoxal phosphate-dependent enzyme [Methylotenera sp.]|nr:aminotransferase class I/II-fold pyridoxal phosphate-dependent enzyme [Oligoflexia bacterium]